MDIFIDGIQYLDLDKQLSKTFKTFNSSNTIKTTQWNIAKTQPKTLEEIKTSIHSASLIIGNSIHKCEYEHE